MKKDIHPKYYPEAKVICSCGNTFTTGSTQELIRTDVCSACHPFFTGEQRIVDTAGQVERFMKRLEKREEFAAEEKALLEDEEAGDKQAEAPKKKPDEAEAAKAIAEKLRGKKATAEKASKEASEKPASKAAKASAKKSAKEAAKATAAEKTKRKRAAKKEAAASEESGGAAD